MRLLVRIISTVITIALLLGTIFSVAGAASPKEDIKQYLVNWGLNRQTVYDSKGKEVPQEKQFILLRDILTGEPKFKVYKRDMEMEKENLYALYDMEGNMLQDFAPYGYRAGFGDYLIRFDSELSKNMMAMESEENNYYIALWNYKTGKDEVLGVARISLLDDTSVLLHKTYSEPSAGVMRIENGKGKLYPLPKGYYNEQACRGNIVAEVGTPGGDGKDRSTVLLSNDFTTLVTKNRLNGNFVGLRGPYLIYNEGDKKGVITQEGKEIYEIAKDEGIDYFDGEIVLVRKVKEESTVRTWSYEMAKLDGTDLASGYNRIAAISKDGDTYGNDNIPSEQFIGVKGETAELLNRDGEVIVSQTIKGLMEVQSLGNGIYSYGIPIKSSNKDSENEESMAYGLLDDKLNIILEAKKYIEIYDAGYQQYADGKYVPSGLLRANKTTSGGLMRIDMLDTKGNVVVENLTQGGVADENILTVVKGFSAGLMDFQGKWIVKQSIFDILEDEKERIY